MKKVFLLSFMAFVSAVSAQTTETQQVDSTNASRFKFEEEIHDFETVKEGPPVEAVFTFKNVGNVPLVIGSVISSCGATMASWSKEPVIPGKFGKVTVMYNTAGRVGPIGRAVYIQSNAYMPKYKGDRYELKIKGTVVPNEGK